MRSEKAVRLKKLSYIEISFETHAGDLEKKACAYDFLASCGLGPEAVACFEFQGAWRISAYTRSFRTLKKIGSGYRKALLRGLRLQWKILEREDWFDKWQLDYRIMPLGARFVLVPLWQRDRFKGKSRRMPVYLDPKGAFGSGGHPTTQIMAALMERAAGKFESFLDLGTGTGILSVIASRLGASRIWSLDRDSASVRAARFNLNLNRVRAERVFRGDLRKLGRAVPFGLVGINVISTLLMEASRAIFGKVRKGGYLAVSGIHLQNLAEVRGRLRHPDFRCLKVMKKRGWAGLLFKRFD